MNPIPLTFRKSAAVYTDLPEDSGYEVIFAGYSNVGKSSLINALANQQNLAKSSKTPGRTQLFNIFDLDRERRILDLPGYGFAKVKRSIQTQWQQHLDDYLSHRKCLKGLVIITDIRRGLRPMDIDLIAWSHEANVPFCLILNKADKLSRNQIQAAKNSLTQLYRLSEEEMFVCSSSKKTGLDNIIFRLNQWFDLRSK